jgi:hypothetical protein
VNRGGATVGMAIACELVSVIVTTIFHSCYACASVVQFVNGRSFSALLDLVEMATVCYEVSKNMHVGMARWTVSRRVDSGTQCRESHGLTSNAQDEAHVIRK